jgi:hypothetical protein
MNDDSLEKWKVDMERYKCELEKWKTQSLHNLETWKTEMHHSAVVYQEVNMQGQADMKAALLINGGASVAMLAFIGTAMNNGTESCLLSKLCFSMLMFIAGVLSIAFAFGVTYLSGVAYSEEKIKLSSILVTIATILVVIGYVLFIIGSLNAYCAFTNSLS